MAQPKNEKKKFLKEGIIKVITDNNTHMHAKSLQSCPTLCDPMDCSLLSSSVHGEFSWQEYWSGLPFLFPGNLPDPGIKTESPALQVGSLPSEPPGKPPKTP